MNIVVKALSFLSLAVAVFASVVLVVGFLNKAEVAEKPTWLVLLILGGFSASYLLNRVSNR